MKLNSGADIPVIVFVGRSIWYGAIFALVCAIFAVVVIAVVWLIALIPWVMLPTLVFLGIGALITYTFDDDDWKWGR